MKKKILVLAGVALVIVAAAAAFLIFGNSDPHKADLMLHLKLDEGKGLNVSDASGNLADVELDYHLAHAAYTENQDPQWRKNGVKGGCLLFDGTTYITYNKNHIKVQGGALTISAWIAPRTFE
jgi:hypothetical protein